MTGPARVSGWTARLSGAARRAADALGGLATSRAGAAGRGEGAGFAYAPVDDDRADPGEVVWAWVPFEEDPRRGKDRPVLVVGRDGAVLLALQLTSKDHDLDEAQEAAEGRYWVDVGTGAWDRYRRPSEARVNRLVRLPPGAVRRTGARLDEDVFARVVTEVRKHSPRL
ncbi:MULTISPECIES: type II toxin-antitoxin system PemK/MazF family toxin [unclassified Ornithinimicrobium]|uniref:type II toxin-antitoxin system PemK/MazF family toxin n=1 Tax=unclassified Ornithinimicrobium TaxID=2615080 RepID=UPI00385468FE